MIDITGSLKINMLKLVGLWILFVVYPTALAPIDLLGYFKSGFGL